MPKAAKPKTVKLRKSLSPADQRELDGYLSKAVNSGRYMVAVWRIEDGKVHLNAMLREFLHADFETAITNLETALNKQKDWR